MECSCYTSNYDKKDKNLAPHATGVPGADTQNGGNPARECQRSLPVLLGRQLPSASEPGLGQNVNSISTEKNRPSLMLPRAWGTPSSYQSARTIVGHAFSVSHDRNVNLETTVTVSE